MKYAAELTKAMDFLAENPQTIFLGQAVEYPGTAMSTTLKNISKEKQTLIHSLWKAEILRKQGNWGEALPIYQKLSTQSEYPQIQKISIFFTNWEPN